MSGAPVPGKHQSKGELTTAKTLNTVATIGAGHAIVASLPKGTRQKLESLAPRRVAVPVKRLMRKVPKAGASASGKLALAGSAGWLGFHGAELAGDIMARRSINNQLKSLPVKKSYKSMAFRYGAAAAAGAGATVEVQDRRKQRRKALLALAQQEQAGQMGVPVHKGQTQSSDVTVVDTIAKAHHPGVLGVDTALAAPLAGVYAIAKRQFSSEADRQRRLGTYAGLGLGSSVVLGDAARRHLQPLVGHADEAGKKGQAVPVRRLKDLKGARAVGMGLKDGSRLRSPLLLGGAALATGAAGAAAYKRGISERNRPWN